jgi:hypothetical protein
MPLKINSKETTAIINSLTGGVVPKIGVQHITVGRTKEVEVIVKVLKEVKAGHSIVKFWVGDYGAGKSFMLHLLNTVAMKQKFVVSNADFTPHARLYSNDGKGLATYTALMDNIAIQTKPEGGALPLLLEKWIEQTIMQTAQTHNILFAEIRNPEYFNLIGNAIMKTINEISDVGGFDFGLAVTKYYEGFISGDDSLKKSALKWLKGEYRTKTEAKQELPGVSDIINDRNYYDMLKNFCKLFVCIGYGGFVINLDEAVNLYKISNPGMRQKNYETLLRMYNDCFQGKISHLFFNFATTAEALTDEKRGLYSYTALTSRLAINTFETAAMRDYVQPVIRLMPLNHNEIFVLLKNLKKIFDLNYQVEMDFSDKDIQTFMEEIFNKPGASEFLTPREVIRDFLNILNILRQNPEVNKFQLFENIRVVDENHDKLEEQPTVENPDTELETAQSTEAKTEYKGLAAELKYWKNTVANTKIKTDLRRMIRIADIIQEKCDTAGDVFFMRHADTLAKLLKQYCVLENSGLNSPEIQDSMLRIRETIATTRNAFEQELINNFKSDLLEIEAESEAYIQQLQNRGLIEN